MGYYSVALDGPAGAGKSTIAKACAKLFNFLYVDTGAIYRTLGLAALNSNVDVTDKSAVLNVLSQIKIDLKHGEDGLQHMYLNGKDVSGEIRTPEVSMAASTVSAYPEVRSYLMDMQRNLAATNHVIMDGRDIGTVVLPNARLKIFITASVEARAQRRYLELQQKGQDVSLEAVLEDMKLRDYNDTNRAAAPLKPAEDSVYLDTSDLNFEESVNAVSNLIKERFEL